MKWYIPVLLLAAAVALTWWLKPCPPCIDAAELEAARTRAQVYKVRIDSLNQAIADYDSSIARLRRWRAGSRLTTAQLDSFFAERYGLR